MGVISCRSREASWIPNLYLACQVQITETMECDTSIFASYFPQVVYKKTMPGVGMTLVFGNT